MTILDLGCGTGNELLPYYNKGLPVIGIDLDQKNIDICKKLMPNGTFVVGDVTQVALTGYENISYIICTEVIEHVDDWKQLIQNISTIPGNPELYLTTPFHVSEKKLLSLRPSYWKEIGHQHFFTCDKLTAALVSHGWQITKQRRWNATLYFELRSLFKRNARCIRHTYYKQILPLPLLLFYQLFRPNLFQTKLKYIPIWIITLPIGRIIDIFWGAGIQIRAKK